jgi:hypothetical protein
LIALGSTSDSNFRESPADVAGILRSSLLPFSDFPWSRLGHPIFTAKLIFTRSCLLEFAVEVDICCVAIINNGGG